MPFHRKIGAALRRLSPVEETRLGKIGLAAPKFAVRTLQGIARSAASVPLSLARRPEIRTTPQSSLLERGLSQVVFGGEPLESIGTRIQRLPGRVEEFGKELGVPVPSQRFTQRIAPLAVFGGIALDVLPGGRQAKTGTAAFRAAGIHLAEQVRRISPSFFGRATETGREFIGSFKRNLVDSFSPIADSVRKSGVKLSATADPRLLRNRVLGANSISSRMLAEGLEPTLRSVGARNIRSFNQYLAARHALDVAERGVETGIDLTHAWEYTRTLAPQFEKAADDVTMFTQRVLKYATDAGLVSGEMYETLLKRYPHYVPLHRVFEELGEQTGLPTTRAVASLAKQHVIQPLKGSLREIVPPLESVVEKTYQIVREAEVNRTAKSVSALRHLDAFRDLIRPVKEAGKRPTISVFEDGKRALFEVPEEFADAAKNLGQQSMNILTRVLAAPVRLARLGFTGVNIPFIATNLVRDQLFSLLTTNRVFRTSIMNPYNFATSFFDTLRLGGAYNDFLAAGGGYSAFFQMGRREARQTVRGLASGPGAKIARTVLNPTQWLSGLEDLVSLGEQATRVQQFRGTRVALGEIGRVDPFAAPTSPVLEALRAGRENTVDFAKKGAWGNVLNSVLIYLNAGIQGSRTMVRTFRERPVPTGFKLATSLYAPVAITTLWNTATPERRAAYMDIPEWERNNFLILLPPNPQVNEEGKYVGAVKIPLPQGFSALTIPIRVGVEHIAGIDQQSIPNALFEALAKALPVDISSHGELFSRLTPTAILPFLEARTNTQLFTGAPLIPRGQLDLPPAEQTKEEIAASVEAIGRATNMSPILLQNFVRGYTGGVGLQVLNAIDRGLAKAGIIAPEDIGGRGLIEDLQFRFSRVRTGEREREEFAVAGEYKQRAASREAQEDKAAQEIYAELQKLPREQWKPRLSELKKNGVLTEAIYDEIEAFYKAEQSGASASDRFVRSLPIPERAEYIRDKLQAIPQGERRAYLSELKKKGILTENVYEELRDKGYLNPQSEENKKLNLGLVPTAQAGAGERGTKEKVVGTSVAAGAVTLLWKALQNLSPAEARKKAGEELQRLIERGAIKERWQVTRAVREAAKKHAFTPKQRDALVRTGFRILKSLR